MSSRRRFIEPRLPLLLAALGLTLFALVSPAITALRPVYAYFFVIDITRSMNVADYQRDGQHLRRLDFVKDVLRRLLPRLPCGSRVGIGLFSERQTAPLIMPVEVCGNYAALDAALARIDWRMAWAADSNIAKGLYNTLQLVVDLRDAGRLPPALALVFFTDGHEAPPVNPNYAPDFAEVGRRDRDGEIVPGTVTLQRQAQAAAGAAPRFDGEAGTVRGLIVGVGGHGLSPIPKFDEEGHQIGEYAEDEVPQASRFGEPTEAERRSIDGYEARNAPWGRDAARGNEHLSQVREAYLQELAGKTGLVYHPLQSLRALQATLQSPQWARLVPTRIESGFVAAAVALLALLVLYALPRGWPARNPSK
ncbi:MAG: vWA domain-containing protein [Gammaproteobacteria bacterium]